MRYLRRPGAPSQVRFADPSAEGLARLVDAGPGADAHLEIELATGVRASVRTLARPAHFGGAQWYVACPGCGSRVMVLWWTFTGPKCRGCAGLPYLAHVDHRGAAARRVAKELLLLEADPLRRHAPGPRRRALIQGRADDALLRGARSFLG